MKSNKGFSLVELIVAFAILAIAGTAVYGLMSAGTINFKRTGADVGLQYEQQVVVNRLRDTLIEASKAVNYGVDGEGNQTLLVYSLEDMGVTSSGAHTHEYKYRVSKIFLDGDKLRKISVLYDTVDEVTTLSGVAAGDDSLLGENVTHLNFDLSDIANGRIGFEITFEQDGREVTTSQIVSLRNNIIDSTSSGEIFVSSSVMTESFIDSVMILRNGVDAEAETTIYLDGTNDITVPFTYKIKANEYSEGTYHYTGIWSLVSSVAGISVNANGEVRVSHDVATGNNLATLRITSVDDPSRYDEVSINIQSGGVYPVSVQLLNDSGAAGRTDYEGYSEFIVYPKITYSDGTVSQDPDKCRWETNMDRTNPEEGAMDPVNKLPAGCVYDVSSKTFTAVNAANDMTAYFKVTLKEPTIDGVYKTAELSLPIVDVQEYLGKQELILGGPESLYINRGMPVTVLARWNKSLSSDFYYHWKIEPYGDTWLNESNKNAADYPRRNFDDLISVDMSDKTDTGDGWFVTKRGINYIDINSKTWLDWNDEYKVKVYCVATEGSEDPDGNPKPISQYNKLYGAVDERGVYKEPVAYIVTFSKVKVILEPADYVEVNSNTRMSFISDQNELRRASDGRMNAANEYLASTLYGGNTVRMYKIHATGVKYSFNDTSALYLYRNGDSRSPQFTYYNSAKKLTPKYSFSSYYNDNGAAYTAGFSIQMNSDAFKSKMSYFDEKGSAKLSDKPAYVKVKYTARDDYGNSSEAYYLTGTSIYSDRDLELTGSHFFKIKYSKDLTDVNYVEIY